MRERLLGHAVSEETRRKISEALRARPKQLTLKLRPARLAKERVAEILRDVWARPEVRARRVASLCATNALPATKARRGEGQRQTWLDASTRKRRIEGNKASAGSPRRSQAVKAQWAARRADPEALALFRSRVSGSVKALWPDPDYASHQRSALTILNARRRQV